MSEGVQFCTTPDGVQLGYSVFGAGRPLVIIPSWWMSPEADRRRLIGRDFWNDLPGGYRTITYDRRGIGASTREVGTVSLEMQVEDLRVLTEQLKLPPFDIWAFGDAVAIAARFIARFPERVNRLVLYCPWSHTAPMEARDPTGRAVEEERIAGLKGLIRADWGFASRAFAQILYPKGPIEAQEASTKAIRETQTPEVALRYMDFCHRTGDAARGCPATRGGARSRSSAHTRRGGGSRSVNDGHLHALRVEAGPPRAAPPARLPTPAESP